MRFYRPDELFDADGRPTPIVLANVPGGDTRLGAVPEANGGTLLRELPLPDPHDFVVKVTEPGASSSEPTRALGEYTPAIRAEPNRAREGAHGRPGIAPPGTSRGLGAHRPEGEAPP